MASAAFCSSSRVSSLVVLLALVPALAGWTQDSISRDASGDVPLGLPRSLSSQVQLSLVRARSGQDALTAAERLLEEMDQEEGVLPVGPVTYTSFWCELDRLLEARDSELRDLLRESHTRATRGRLGKAVHVEAASRVLRTYRRYPWSRECHEALVTLGEAALRRGRAGLALRSFQDVVQHTDDKALRTRARTGVWLALMGAQASREELERAFEEVPAEEEFPWMGRLLPAAEIRVRLLEAREMETPPRVVEEAGLLQRLSLERLSLPPRLPWGFTNLGRVSPAMRRRIPSPLGEVQAHGDRVIVSGPHLLACFGDDSAAPLWHRTPESFALEGDEDDRREAGFPVAGSFRPCVSQGRVFTRWCPEPRSWQMRAVVAFDLDTGEAVWSTARDPAWESMFPVSDPQASDGRLYVLALGRRATGLLPLFLGCLDAADGALLWSRFLGSQDLSFLADRGGGRAWEERTDVLPYGNAVTVHAGRVYCSTNMGIVACCDARDGLVQWMHTYERTGLRQSRSRGRDFENPEVLERRGAPPLLCGDRLIVAPRDFEGVLCLERATGLRLWEQKAVPSKDLVGLHDGSVILRDSSRMAALAGSSGQVVWETALSRPVRGRVLLSGRSLLAVTENGVLRFDPGSGRLLEERGWEGAEPFEDFALEGSSLRGTAWGSTSAGAGELARPASQREIPPELPLRKEWYLRRAEPWLWVSPEDPALVVLLSRGVLECLEVAREDRVCWQRFARPDLFDLAFVGDTVLLFCQSRVSALEIRTGACRWETRTAFDILEADVYGEYLLVAKPDGERSVGMIRLDSGEWLWERELGEGHEFHHSLAAGRLHVVLDGLVQGSGRKFDIEHFTLDPENGSLLHRVPFPETGAWRKRQLACGGGLAFYLTEEGLLGRYSLADRRETGPATRLPGAEPGSVERFQIRGPWLQIGQRVKRDRQRVDFSHWLVSIEDPSRFLKRSRPGLLFGSTLLEPEDRSFVLADLPSGETLHSGIPHDPEAGEGSCEILESRLDGNRLWLLSAVDPPERRASPRVRLDTFDTATGRHLASQVLRGVPRSTLRRPPWTPSRRSPWRWWVDDESVTSNQLLLTRGAVLVTDGEGVHALASVSSMREGPDEVRLLHLLPVPIRVDGDTAEWPPAHALELHGADGTTASLYLGHDEETLYLAAVLPDLHPVPWGGLRDPGNGDWLELGLGTAQQVSHHGMGFDFNGTPFLESFSRERDGWRGGNDSPEGAPRVSVTHDLSTGKLTYELAMPFSGILQKWKHDWRDIGLSLILRDDSPGGGGQQRRFLWGEGLRESGVLPDAHQPLYLHPSGHRALQTASYLVEALPRLPASFSWFQETSRVRTRTWRGLLRLLGGFVAEHPESITAERLAAMDRMLRARFRIDPRDDLLRIAREAGVPESESLRYRHQAGSFLSQWVYLSDGDSHPQAAVIQLFDGTGAFGREHAGYIRQPRHSSHHWLARLSGRLPAGEWHELRIPLTLLGMSERPLCGILFSQWGGAPLVWDRTAITAAGGEEVIIDDVLPDGTALGEWEWVSRPTRSGDRAHLGQLPEGRYDVTHHGLVNLSRPAFRHLPPVREDRHLSQKVFLDPSDPPELIAVNLHDGVRWRARYVWGRKKVAGTCLGQLPEPGGWKELQVPLVGTAFESRPILGLAFGAQGGRAVWDHTVLVLDGREHVLLEDAFPPVRSTARRPGTEGVRGGALVCDGSSYLEVSHSSALEPAHLTLEAWIRPEELPTGGERRRWLVSKNIHECMGGHYGLVLLGDRLGAYMNFGEGENSEERYQTWSRGGRLSRGRWFHVAMTYDGNDLRVYLDGEPVASRAIGLPRKPGTGPLAIGRRQDGYTYFRGLIDEVALYDRALSSDELNRNMRAVETARPGEPEARVPQGLIARWDLEAYSQNGEGATPVTWTTGPVHSGSRAHTHEPSAGYASHAVFPLEEPVDLHLPFDREEALGLLREHLAGLGPSEEAWTFFQELLELAPERRVDHFSAFLEALPAHPRSGEVLADLLEEYRLEGQESPVARVEELARRLPIPGATLYRFHRDHAHPGRSFLKSWRVVAARGGHGGYVSPEEDVGGAAWTLEESRTNVLDLERLSGSSADGLAYAACWVWLPREQSVNLEVGNQGILRIWVDGVLVLEAEDGYGAWPGEHVVTRKLQAGWNELLVGSLIGQDGWGFCLEIVDALGRGPPPGMRVSSSPPAAAERNGIPAGR